MIMKRLITYLLLIVCIYANGQSEKVNDYESQADEAKKEWRKSLDRELVQLKRLRLEVNALKTEVATLKKDIADLKKGKDLIELIQVIGLEILEVEDLPTNLQPDELGVAFVSSEDNGLSLALFIDNQWKIISL